MKKSLLMVVVVLGAMSQVACSNNDKQQAQTQASMCAASADPAGCLQKTAAMNQVPPGINNLSTVLNKGVPFNGIPVAGNPNSGVLNQVNTKSTSSAVDQAAVQAQAQKVAAQLKADSLDPRSLYYDPPQNRKPSSVSDLGGSASPASATMPADVSSGVAVGGEIAR